MCVAVPAAAEFDLKLTRKLLRPQKPWFFGHGGVWLWAGKHWSHMVLWAHPQSRSRLPCAMRKPLDDIISNGNAVRGSALRRRFNTQIILRIKERYKSGLVCARTTLVNWYENMVLIVLTTLSPFTVMLGNPGLQISVNFWRLSKQSNISSRMIFNLVWYLQTLWRQ